MEVAVPLADEQACSRALILQFGPEAVALEPPSLRDEIIRPPGGDPCLTGRRRGAPKTADRLGRMLVVVPYLVQHPGTPLGEVAALFDVASEQLRRDLDLLFMSGLPPYGPGDLIDVDVDEDDRIWITMADHFARPLRLTRSEALALYVRGTELARHPRPPAGARSGERPRQAAGRRWDPRRSTPTG